MNEESSKNGTAANQGSRRDDPPPPPSAPTTRPTRSKTGCLTCRRRKVRCDEQRPRCSHCERLNLECRWRPTPSFGPPRKMETTNGVAPSPAAGPNGVIYGSSPDNMTDSPGSNHWPQNPGAVDQLFDFASFMWDAGGATLGQASPGGGNECFNTGLDSLNAWSLPNSTYNGSHTNPPLVATPTSRPNHPVDTSWSLPARPPSSAPPAQTAEDRHLIEYFVRTSPPPILADVETQKAWSSVRQILVSMSNVSTMVRCAILAFSNLLLCRRDAPWMQCPPRHYENATAQLMAIGDLATMISHSPLREHLLVTIFFLSYVDIVEDRVEGAHANLKRAFEIFQQGDKRGFRPLELRLLSWIRHLDARVVSAGGEGLFLSDNCEAILVHPSPGSVVADVENNDGSPPDEVRELDIEDVLFQVLYHPGIVFFQKVQSFMGRISRIDRWHRSRGTVEDETEVINIALQILKDLRKVYDDRPALMDHAVSGHLAAPHVSAELAFSITRAFRTYLSNYHASKVHLHRVAYTNLPLTRETEDALSQIRHLTRLMVAELGAEDSLPVSQLWPLLMLGAEEKDPEEREWIKAQIRRMKNVATNALITGQVLEEVQARQDAGGGRADIRGVMHDIFDSCFAIM